MLRYLICALLLCGLAASARALQATVFASTPDPAPAALMTPRAIAANSAGTRLCVLDTGLHRAVVFNLDGTVVKTQDLPDAIVVTDDTLLPQPSLAATKETVYWLALDRTKPDVVLTPIDGPGKVRRVALPAKAADGAVTLDAAGRVLAAYLSLQDGKLELALAREDQQALEVIGSLRDPCEGQWKNLSVTGCAAGPDGRVVIGIAQAGEAAYGSVRAWIIEATLKDGALDGELHEVNHLALIDSRGKLQDRYRVLQAMAGTPGFPEKPCVPLFTAPALGPDGLLVTGGCTQDPFTRVYGGDGRVCTLPRTAPGGQSVAVLDGKTGPRIFALNVRDSRVDELSLDGRAIATLGSPVAYDLSQPLALAADQRGVYVAASWGGGRRLVRFHHRRSVPVGARADAAARHGRCGYLPHRAVERPRAGRLAAARRLRPGSRRHRA